MEGPEPEPDPPPDSGQQTKEEKQKQPKTVEDLLTCFKKRFNRTEEKIRVSTVTTNLESCWCGTKEEFELLQETVVGVSRIKAQASMFGNWLVLYLLQNQQELPELTH